MVRRGRSVSRGGSRGFRGGSSSRSRSFSPYRGRSFSRSRSFSPYRGISRGYSRRYSPSYRYRSPQRYRFPYRHTYQRPYSKYYYSFPRYAYKQRYPYNYSQYYYKGYGSPYQSYYGSYPYNIGFTTYLNEYPLSPYLYSATIYDPADFIASPYYSINQYEGPRGACYSQGRCTYPLNYGDCIENFGDAYAFVPGGQCTGLLV